MVDQKKNKVLLKIDKFLNCENIIFRLKNSLITKNYY